MRLVDTTFLIDISRNKESAVRKIKELEKKSSLFCSEISRYEMISGVYALEGNQDKKLVALEGLFKTFECLPLNSSEAALAGSIAGDLHRKGKDIGHTDCLIAGTALANGISIIVTRNKTHFERIPEITVETY